jgi:hypothetical protein
MEVSKMAIKWLSLILLGLLFLFGGGIGWVGSREMSVPMYVYWHLISVPSCTIAMRYLYMPLSSSNQA